MEHFPKRAWRHTHDEIAEEVGRWEPLAPSRPQWPQPPRHFWQLSRFDQQKQILANYISKIQQHATESRDHKHIKYHSLTNKLNFFTVSGKVRLYFFEVTSHLKQLWKFVMHECRPPGTTLHIIQKKTFINLSGKWYWKQLKLKILNCSICQIF